jgi:SAM-dependent methyltransferase
MTFDRSSRTSFNQVADLYDKARPSYPEALIEDILSLSGLSGKGRILEIGCGTGKATLPFARRGYSMLCLELGTNLATVARQNCTAYPQVEIQTMAFEAWPLQERAFDLVISAQAFHWIPPEIGYPKVHRALKKSGAMALFWNQYPEPKTEFFQALAEVYRAKAPQLVNDRAKLACEDLTRQREAEIKATGLFSSMRVSQYPWEQSYSADQYLKLLNTYSDHLTLDEATRRDLFEAIGHLINQYGGIVAKPYIATLYFARVRA